MPNPEPEVLRDPSTQQKERFEDALDTQGPRHRAEFASPHREKIWIFTTYRRVVIKLDPVTQTQFEPDATSQKNADVNIRQKDKRHKTKDRNKTTQNDKRQKKERKKQPNNNSNTES